MRERFRRFVVAAVSAVTRFCTNGPGLLREFMALALSSVDDRRKVVSGKGGFFVRVSNPLERWRADTLLGKEPETVTWLDTTITADTVFYDVGANIGLYSLYACHLNVGVRAVCFEPESLNFGRLNQNINDNGLSGRALPLSIGLGRLPAVDVFRLSFLEAGRALHGERCVPVGTEMHRQGITILPLDQVRAWGGDELLPPPTHLKIDVDGPELDVLAGAERTLALPSLRHVLVEVVAEQMQSAIETLEAYGFQMVGRGADAPDGTNLIFRRD